MSDKFPHTAAMLAGFIPRVLGVDMSWLPGGGGHVDAAVDSSDESTADSDIDSVDDDSSSDEDDNNNL
jgi:hypothetical protein